MRINQPGPPIYEAFIFGSPRKAKTPANTTLQGFKFLMMNLATFAGLKPIMGRLMYYAL
jgi:hypothetical protein